MLARYLPLFSVLILFICVLPFTVDASPAGVTSFFWLKPGTQATYAFQQAHFIFDDYANGFPFRGNYSWRCTAVNDTHAVLDVQVNLELFKLPEWQAPAHINYIGTEFLEKAAAGDLSFVKRIPLDQVIGRFELYNSSVTPGVPDGIGIASPVVISKRSAVTVDLDTMLMTDEEGVEWGRWILWIDPFQYTLEGWQHPQVETFVMNWLNTTVDAKVYYVSPTDNLPPLNTILGVRKRWFYAGVPDMLVNEFLSEQGWSGIFPAWVYEPRTGLLLNARTSDFIDDFLGQRLGSVALHTFTENLNLTSVKFVGDLNGDWLVNISDIAIPATAFATRPGDAKWNSLADVNEDGVVNIVDITTIATVFGTQYITAD